MNENINFQLSASIDETMFNKNIQDIKKKVNAIEKDGINLHIDKSTLNRDLKAIESKEIHINTKIDTKGLSNQLNTLKQGFDFKSITGKSEQMLSGLTSELGAASGGMSSLLGGVESLGAAAGPEGMALAAYVAVIAKMGTDAMETSNELNTLRNEIGSLSNETGQDLDNLTTETKALSATTGATTKEVVTMTKSFGKFGLDSKKSLQLVSYGLLTSKVEAGEFADQIKEYAPQFQAAGLSATDLVNVLNTSIKQGIVSDKGLDAIKEASLRLNGMNKSAYDSIKAIGLNANEIQKSIKEGSMTAGQAITLISNRINDLGPTSTKAQEAVSNIFGSAGEDAGAVYLSTLGSIIGKTDIMVDKENKLYKIKQNQLNANRELAKSQLELATALGYENSGMETLKIQVQEFYTRYLTAWIKAMEPLFTYFKNIYKTFSDLISLVTGGEGDAMTTFFKGVEYYIKAMTIGLQAYLYVMNKIVSAVDWVVTKLKGVAEANNSSIKALNQLNGYNDPLKSTLESGSFEEKRSAILSKLKGDIESDIKSNSELYSLYERLSKVKGLTENIDFGGELQLISSQVRNGLKKFDNIPANMVRSYLNNLLDANKFLGQELAKVNETTKLQSDIDLIGGGPSEPKKDDYLEKLKAREQALKELNEYNISITEDGTRARIAAEEKAFVLITNFYNEIGKTGKQVYEELGTSDAKYVMSQSADLKTISSDYEAMYQKIRESNKSIVDAQAKGLGDMLKGITSHYDLVQSEAEGSVKDILKSDSEYFQTIKRFYESQVEQYKLVGNELVQEDKKVYEALGMSADEYYKMLNDLNNKILADEQRVADEKVKITKDGLSKELKLKKDTNEQEEKMRQQKLQYGLQAATQFNSALASLDDSLVRMKLHNITSGSKEEDKILKKQFERNKAYAVVNALINGAMAITNIWATVPKVDFGVMTGVLTAASIATTGAEVAAILSQQYDGTSSSGTAPTAPSIPTSTGSNLSVPPGNLAPAYNANVNQLNPVKVYVTQADIAGAHNRMAQIHNKVKIK